MTLPPPRTASTVDRQQFWGRAGHRLTEDEQRRRAGARAHRRREQHQRDTQSRETAYRAWKLGALAPWRITFALDSGGHEGPEIDVACGAVEPAVDEWEAGTRYPTFEQLELLAALTGYGLAWFAATDEPLDIRQTTMWGHMNKREKQQWKNPILTFDDDAAMKCPGTADYLDAHLF